MSNMKEIKYSLEFTQAQLAEAKPEISEVKTKNFDLLETDKIRRNQLNALKIENDQLKEKILNLDTYIRRENLIFSGLQEEKDESTSQCRKKLRHLFKNQLQIEQPDQIEFQRFHRLGKKADGKDRDIIARFVRYVDRKRIWENKTKFKGSDVIVKKDLPPEIESRKACLFPIYKATVSQKKKTLLIADKL